MNTIITAVLFALASVAVAHEHPVPTMPKEFDTLKGMIGTWETTYTEHGKEETGTVVYELTSGGTAITEKLGAGTEHEMVSVYHKNGKTLGMTHFCALGNAPQMKLKKATDKSLTFEMTGNAGIQNAKEMHMHAVTLNWKDKDTVVQEWTNYVNGKKGETAIFTLKRKS